MNSPDYDMDSQQNIKIIGQSHSEYDTIKKGSENESFHISQHSKKVSIQRRKSFFGKSSDDNDTSRNSSLLKIDMFHVEI